MTKTIGIVGLLLVLFPRSNFACPYMEGRRLQRGGGGRGGGGGNNNNNNVLSPDDAVPLSGLTALEAVAAAKIDIDNMMNDNRAAEFVRLAFHDCLGGICDGCVDLSNSGNFGLDDPIEDLEGLVIRYSQTLTRGDMWVLAGLTAAEHTQQNNNNNNAIVPFAMQYVGRPTCPDPTGGPDRLVPSAHITSGDLIDFFAENFNFTPRETTAIIGAHTL